MRIIDADAFKRYLDDGDECINCPKKGMFCSYHCELDNVESNQFARIIDEQPTIDAVEVKHGEWEEKEIFHNPIEEWQSARCSMCGRYHTTPYMYYFDNYNYCPNCGAKMDGEVKSNE